MKRSASAAVALMGILLTLPVLAQEPATDAANPAAAPTAFAGGDMMVADAAPEDEMAEEAPPVEAPVEEPPPVEAPPVEEPVAVEAPPEEAPVEEVASEEPGEPFQFYVGVDKAEVDFSLSDDALEAEFGGDSFDSSMYRIRAGMRILEAVALEAHYGIADDKDDEPGKLEIAEYYGLFVVPTGNLFDLFEIAVPIGYSSMKGERGNASHTFDGVSYGLNIEVPITLGSAWLPDLRLGGGGQVYRASNDSRVYGYHFGVRFDFKI